MRTSRLLIPVLLTLGCASKPAAPQGDKASGGGEDRPELHAIMQEHFVHVDDLEKAIIAGDLAEAKASAQWIMDNHVEGLNDTWIPHIEALEKAAAMVTGAPDLAQASLGAAQVAGACGGCHAAHGIDLKLGAPAPEEGTGLQAHMKRHQWAADRMWDAIVGNSDAAWKEAAKALEDAPLHLDSEPSPEPGEFLTAAAKTVHDIGSKSGGLTEKHERVGALGEFLSTCAGCHTELGVQPGMN